MAKVNKAPSGRTNWDRLRALPEAEIEQIAANDPDNPPHDHWDDAVRGAPSLIVHAAKTPVNAKFDADVVNWFKAQGRGYQTRMNAALRRYMEMNRTVT
jgi:uncharacterized protein (DUF4415 family)